MLEMRDPRLCRRVKNRLISRPEWKDSVNRSPIHPQKRPNVLLYSFIFILLILFFMQRSVDLKNGDTLAL